VTVSAAGVPSQPTIAAAAPVGALPGKIAAMDVALAEALAKAPAGDLDDLSVLSKARALHPDARPDFGKPDKPSKDKKGGPGPR
jgi:hypothetical protein